MSNWPEGHESGPMAWVLKPTPEPTPPVAPNRPRAVPVAPPESGPADEPSSWVEAGWTQPDLDIGPGPASDPAPSGRPGAPPVPPTHALMPRQGILARDESVPQARLAAALAVDDWPGEPRPAVTDGPEPEEAPVAAEAPGSPPEAADEPMSVVGQAPGAAATPVEAIADPEGWEDELTGIDGPALWTRLLVPEIARCGRYSRPLTVVLVEVVGLDGLAQVWGGDVGLVALQAAARSLRSGARTSDIVCRIGPTRFGILLTETDEIAAINFVERVRAAGPLPEPGRRSTLRYAFGWTSVGPGDDPTAVVGRAERRLAEELQPRVAGPVDVGA